MKRTIASQTQGEQKWEGFFYEVYKFCTFIYLIKSLCLNYENVLEKEAWVFGTFSIWGYFNCKIITWLELLWLGKVVKMTRGIQRCFHGLCSSLETLIQSGFTERITYSYILNAGGVIALMFLETIYSIPCVPPEIQLRLPALHLIEMISDYSFLQIMTSVFPFTFFLAQLTD